MLTLKFFISGQSRHATKIRKRKDSRRECASESTKFCVFFRKHHNKKDEKELKVKCPKFEHPVQSSDIYLSSQNLNFCTEKNNFTNIVNRQLIFEILSAFEW